MRLALIVAAALLVTAVPAGAASYPGEGPASARTRALADLGVEFWKERGVTGCPAGLDVLEADDLSGSDVNGEVDGRGEDCRIWIRRGLLRRGRPSLEETAHDTYVCAAVVHEVGHALGLSHSPTGVMRGELGREDGIPWACLAHRPTARRSRHVSRRRAYRNRHQGEGIIRR